MHAVRESLSRSREVHQAQGEDKQRTVRSVRESGSKGRGRHRAQGRAVSDTQGRMPDQGPRAPVKATVRHLPVMNLAFPEVTWPLLTAARVVNSPTTPRRKEGPIPRTSPDPRRARALTGRACAGGCVDRRGGAWRGREVTSRRSCGPGAIESERAGRSRLRVRGACGGLAGPIGPAGRACRAALSGFDTLEPPE